MALITFTSSFGANGDKIAQNVSERLGIELFDNPKLQEMVASMGFSDKEMKDFDEKAPGFFDRLFTKKPARYLELLGSTIYDIAGRGEGVITGHGAQAFLKDFDCALHVMITASEDTRSRWLAEKQNISEAAAKEIVQKMDNRFREFVQYAFKREGNDPSDFDLVINIDKIGTDWAVKLIVDIAGSEKIKSCSVKATEEMKSSSLQRKVEAAIIQNISLFTHIFVKVTGEGKVHLSGATFSEKEREKIISTAQNVPGVSKVTSEIFVRVDPD